MLKHKSILKCIAVFVLSVFIGTLVEASWNHFFHDVLPENDVAYIARHKAAPAGPAFSPHVRYQQEEECAFNRLLSFLSASSFLDVFMVQPITGCTGKNLIRSSDTPESWRGYARRVRDPPAFFVGLISQWSI